MRRQLECMELSLGMGQESAKSLWIRISSQTNMDAVVCCRTPDQEDVDEAAFYQLEEASCSQVLVFMADLNQYLITCQISAWFR